MVPDRDARGDLVEEQPIIDLDHLATFTDGDRSLEAELGALYVSSAEEYLEQMGEALRGGVSWLSAAHALKGASSNLGAHRVATLALEAERSSPDEALLDALRDAIEEVRGFLAGESS